MTHTTAPTATVGVRFAKPNGKVYEIVSAPRTYEARDGIVTTVHVATVKDDKATNYTHLVRVEELAKFTEVAR